MGMHAVVSSTRSPLNNESWLTTLDCGHEVWLTRVNQPKVGLVVKCPRCLCPKCTVKGAS